MLYNIIKKHNTNDNFQFKNRPTGSLFKRRLLSLGCVACGLFIMRTFNSVCQICGKEFYARPNAIEKGFGKYCSMECYIKGSHKRIKYSCEICGKSIERNPFQIKKGVGKYCSRKCQGIAQSKRQIGVNNPNWKPPHKICSVCGEKFKGANKFCSLKCAGIDRVKVKRTCEICGKIFYVRKSRLKYNPCIVCSRKCSNIWYSENIIREKTSNWKGGISPINEQIRKSLKYRLWRKKVFERDNWTCQICKKRGGILHPHHIKSFSKYPELRFDIDNGITFCEKCHRKLHKKVRQNSNSMPRLLEFPSIIASDIKEFGINKKEGL